MIVITTLAEYQTCFWLKVALKLEETGHEVVLLSFDDRSSELLNNSGLTSYNVPLLARAVSNVRFKNNQEALKFYGIEDINYWISHERVTWKLKNGQDLVSRLISYTQAIEEVFSTLKIDGKEITLVQELGGFIAVIASFFAARQQNIDNIFLEPAFFKGRLFPLKNSFSAPTIKSSDGRLATKEVKELLELAIRSQSIVIPQKDAHQYRDAFAKILSGKNIKRVIEKTVDKYVLGKHQEFGHLGRYITLHLGMALNAIRMRSSYTPLDSLTDFIYFPFHVPGDMALTLRSPEYFDQLALVEYMLKIVPYTHIVAVKEHPAQIGGIDALRLKALLKQFDNLVVINPGINNYKVLNKAQLIVSINSKSGAEAGMLGKPSIVLGDAFYKDSPLVSAVAGLRSLKTSIRVALDETKPLSDEQRDSYFQDVWDETYPGELYIQDDHCVNTFSQSITRIVKGLALNP